MRLEKLTDKWAEMSAHGTFCQVRPNVFRCVINEGVAIARACY